MRRLALCFTLGSVLAASPVLACEHVEYDPTPEQLERDALLSFSQSDLIYEGVILGSHDPDKGGRLLVLKAFKGPARMFEIVKLPRGSSCGPDETAFAMGVWARPKAHTATFDGFTPGSYVDTWRKHGLVERSTIAPVVLAGSMFALVLVVVLAGVLIHRVRRRRKRSS
jgi:hypothetical protein